MGEFERAINLIENILGNAPEHVATKCLLVAIYEKTGQQKKGWEQFTDAVIKKISDEKEKVVFLLWGGFAKKKGALIDKNKHCVFTSGHPSPLSANRGYWFGNKHFSKTSDYLKMNSIKTIDW